MNEGNERELVMSPCLTSALAEKIVGMSLFATKRILTAAEAAKYMGVSMSYLYKLTAAMRIPHYKPLGKMCFFDREELEEWLKSNRCDGKG